MESMKIESIFEAYIKKEKTNYGLMISGKWGSGKTFLWKNVLEKKAENLGFKPIYLSLNGINSVREIESILLSKVLPFADKLDNEFIKNSLKFLRNGANVIGNVFGGGTQLSDITKGIDLNLDFSEIILCFDDLERCTIPLKEVLGLINDYTEHKNLKVIICAYEIEIEDKDYDKLKEKIVGRILNYTANYNDLVNSYIIAHTDKEFCDFIDNNKKLIIHFFEKHDIQNLRTFGFYLDNLNELFEHYKGESETIIDNMLFFTAIISNEFKNGTLKISDLKDKKGIDQGYFYIDIEDIIGEDSSKKQKQEKNYREIFIEKYLSTQNDKERFLFSEAIYEFILSGFLDIDKIKDEINKRKGKTNNSEEQNIYNAFMGYNF